MATHSSILAWKIPWTEESGRLQSMGSHKTPEHKTIPQHRKMAMIYYVKSSMTVCDRNKHNTALKSELRLQKDVYTSSLK